MAEIAIGEELAHGALLERDNTMGFASFQELPSRNLQIPDQHFASVSAPPVYDTSQSIKQITALAAYLSPDARARRKAAVAKANYEYRLYSSGTNKDPFFLYKVRAYNDAHMKAINGKLGGQPWTARELAAAKAAGVTLPLSRGELKTTAPVFGSLPTDQPLPTSTDEEEPESIVDNSQMDETE